MGPQAVVVPTDSELLALKVEALLFRQFLKPSDLFDIWFLMSRGIRLSKQQRRRVSEEVLLRETDLAEVERRIGKLTPQRFLADLKRRLPPETLHGWNTATAQSAIDSCLALVRKGIRWR